MQGYVPNVGGRPKLLNRTGLTTSYDWSGQCSSTETCPTAQPHPLAHCSTLVVLVCNCPPYGQSPR